METLTIRTHDTNEMLDITADVQSQFVHMGLRDGALLVFVPHSTAGITINENADPAVQHDMIADLERLFPHN